MSAFTFRTTSKEQHETILKVLYAVGVRYHGTEALEAALQKYPFHAYPALNIDLDSFYVSGGKDHSETTLSGLFTAVAKSVANGPVKRLSVTGSGYDAVIGDKTTKVGCQTFDNDRILALAEEIRKLA
jgi:hypothetical protein